MHAAPSRSWEDVGPRVATRVGSVRHAFFEDDEPPEFDYANISVHDANEMLADYLISLKLRGNINATECCHIAFYATRGGCTGEVLSRLAKAPGA